jgi:two-component system cell cycle sensor histidine kinase/response regulator CckA
VSKWLGRQPDSGEPNDQRVSSSNLEGESCRARLLNGYDRPESIKIQGMASEAERSFHITPHALSLAVAVGIAAAIGVLSYLDWKTSERLSQTADHSRRVTDQVQRLLSLLKDAETGQRGYLLTGDERYLAPYTAALPEITDLTTGLEQDFRGSSQPQAARLVPGLVQAKLQELQETIEIRRRGDVSAALTIVRTDRGKQTMDNIRLAAKQLMDLEQERYTAAQGMVRLQSLRTRIAVLGGTVVLVVLLFGTAVQVRRLIAKLQLAQAQEYNRRAALGATLQSIGDAVIATDGAGIITFINPVAEHLTSWPANQAVGQPLASVFRIISESTREPVDHPVAKVLRDGAIIGLANHTLLITREGRELPIDDSGAPIRDQSGTITGVILVFRDVTMRREAQRAIENSERRYRLLFESNPHPMWVYDQESLRFLAVNRAAVQRYGYEEEEFLGMTLRDIRPAEDIPKLLEATKVPATRLHTEGPWRHRKKDGSVITVEITEHPIVFDGRDACIVLANDITERKRMEEQLHQAQRLDSIGRLAGGIAHDFNNLLTVINGYSEMLLTDTPPGDTKRDTLVEIRSAGDRAASLTQQLLAFSRRQMIQPTVLSVNEVVSEIEKMLRRLIGENINLVTKLAPDLGNITADTGQLQQVIMNLVVNARDAMPKGGMLLIETANVDFNESYVAAHAETQPGPHVMLAVTDTGIGMSEEIKARLFEPFFTTKAKGSGTGLGLATAYGMVKQSGGWIWVYTEPGRGTTFKVYYPRSFASPEASAPVRQRHTLGNETILVVEDQAEVRNFAVAVLAKYGYRVHAAGSGEEALTFSRQFQATIHLLLTDVIMPGLTGRELADELIKERPGIRVLFMSGYTENVIAHASVLGADIEYLQKPFTPELLAAKVRELLESGEES